MKKVLFTLALQSLLTAVSFAVTGKGDPNYKHQTPVRAHSSVHHTHIVVPADHYSI